MITKGEIQVCVRLKAEVGLVPWGSFVAFAPKYFFGLYFKYFINLKTLELGVAFPRCAPQLSAWWQPYSDCRLQNSAGILDWTKFMRTPIW